MKGQFSRDSFDPKKTYSGVYQQQGRMLTDADWNEMVQILKHRMDRTVGGAIQSGSPRRTSESPSLGGILPAKTQPDADDPENNPVTIQKMYWGLVYVDGMYAEILPSDDGIDLNQSVAVGDFLRNQRDISIGSVSGKYTLYVDVWERLVFALQDPDLLDPALHGADTCVRTQTMAQLKLLKKGIDNPWKAPPAKRSALRVVPAPKDENKSDTQTRRGTFDPERNYLFRLEVHRMLVEEFQGLGVGSNFVGTAVILKWSRENGAEQYRNNATQIPQEFWKPGCVYEYFTDADEQQLGFAAVIEHELQRHPSRPTLYSCSTSGEPPSKAPKEDKIAAQTLYVRRWDGMCMLTPTGKGSWKLADDDTPYWNVDIKQSKTTGNLLFDLHELKTNIELQLNRDSRPCDFVTGDYWLALVRDRGEEVTVDIPSAEPVGVRHGYMEIGSVELNDITNPKSGVLKLNGEQIRRLSFPPLTKLTLDRVFYEPFDDNPKTIGETLRQHGKDINDLLLEGDITKQGKVVFEGYFPPQAIVSSDWIPPEDHPRLMASPYTLILGSENSTGSILIGSRFSDTEISQVRAEIDPIKGRFRVHAQNGASWSTDMTIQWWALEATGETLNTQVAVPLKVEPESPTLPPHGQEDFAAFVGGVEVPSGDVQWLVNGVSNPPENLGIGTISEQGIYTAPDVDNRTFFTILARSTHSENMEGEAIVTVEPSENVEVTCRVQRMRVVHTNVGGIIVSHEVPIVFNNVSVKLKNATYDQSGITESGVCVFLDVPVGTYIFSTTEASYEDEGQVCTYNDYNNDNVAISLDNTEITVNLDVEDLSVGYTPTINCIDKP